ncbi:hypothetical protein RYA05_03135 [Pseudomonas syringae pv. actinidiae]|nr:hypothetical protein [Pseudomonas syringae pv. actinidiae]
MSELTCKSCNRPTVSGLSELKRRGRKNPIYGTDFSKPLSELTEDVRNSLVVARTKLADIGGLYWFTRSRTVHVEGLITCVIGTLFNTLQEIIEWEDKVRNTGPSSSDPYPIPASAAISAERTKVSRLMAADPWAGIDMARPVSQLVQEVRMELCNIRGRISDLCSTHFEDRFNEPRCALTCGISELYRTVEETIAHENAGNDTRPDASKLFLFKETLKERVAEASQG